jgi:Uma2 family endonuclease
MSRSVDPEDRILTIEEYERLAEDDRYRTELVRGRLVHEPQPAEEHGWLEIRLGHLLYEFVEAKQLGLVLGTAGYRLEEDPPTVRGPDLSFLSHARIEGRYPARKFRRIAPDLAVEIVSPSNRSRDLVEKAHQFLDAGSCLVWVVNPIRKTVTVYRSRTDVTILRLGDTLDGEGVLPAFRLPLAQLFAIPSASHD